MKVAGMGSAPSQQWLRSAATSIAVVTAAALALPTGAAAQDRYESFTWENDNFQFDRERATDRAYTNGLRYTALEARDRVSAWAAFIAPRLTPWARAAVRDVDGRRSTGWSVGQNMYTPTDITRNPPDSADRPYGGWLYYGMLFRAARKDSRLLHTWELDVGVLGAPSLAKETQKTVHAILGSPNPQGWAHQVPSQLGAEILYAARYALVDDAHDCVDCQRNIDVTAHAGGALGNVFTFLSSGLTVRLGFHIPAGSPERIGPVRIGEAAPSSASERLVGGPSDHVDAGATSAVGHTQGVRPSSWTLYAFGSVDGRATAANVFLDAVSPRINRLPYIGDAVVGGVVGLRGWELGYQLILRTPEFRGQVEHNQYGSLSLSRRW